MEVIYSRQDPRPSIFLAGPSPRGEQDANWRPEALRILEELGFDGIVYVPLPEDGQWAPDYDGQVEWEDRCLQRSDVIVFWIPRDLDSLPGFTTNVEFGMWVSSGKIVLGHPPRAPKTRYLDWHAKKHGVPIREDLKSTLRAAIEMLP